MSVISGSMGRRSIGRKEPCIHREDEPTVLCISLLGLVQRTREHAVQRFYRRTGPCLWVAQSHQLLDYGRKVFDHFHREQNDEGA